jgi:hypothetical protein
MIDVKTDEGPYLEKMDLEKTSPQGALILNGKGFIILPLTLGRLKKAWPICQKIRVEAGNPIAVFQLVIDLLEVALVDDRDNFIRRRRAKKDFRKNIFAADREKIQAAYERIMAAWFPPEEGK